MESVVELKDGAASPRCKAVISQTPLDIAHSFVAETFRFGTDLTVSSASPAVKETVSSPLRVSCSQTEKRKLVVCKLVHNGTVELLLHCPSSFLSVSPAAEVGNLGPYAEAGMPSSTASAEPQTQPRNKIGSAVKGFCTKRCKCPDDEHSLCKRFKCSFSGCKWAFGTNYKLQRHMQVHLGHKPYMCYFPGCGRTVTTLFNLKVHIKRHERVCNEACQVPGCMARFRTQRLLDSHMKEQHPTNKQYSCSYPGCGKSYTFKWNLMSHARKHRISSESLQCPFEGCGRRFDQLCRLKQHQNLHVGLRPYVCPEPGCMWAFPTASKLRRHLLRHTGQRQWVCPHEGCRKSFTRKEHVRGHMSTHSDQRPYACSVPGCIAKFKNKSSLFWHKRRHESKTFEVEDCGDLTDVAAYASIVAPSAGQSTDEIMTSSHGMTFSDLESGAFYLQTQLLQDDDPLTSEMCDFEESSSTTAADTSPVCFPDLCMDDSVYTATTINLHDLE